MKPKVKSLLCLMMALVIFMSVAMPAAFAYAKGKRIVQGNVSDRPVTWNATVNPNLPRTVCCFNTGKTICVNFHVSELDSLRYTKLVLQWRHNGGRWETVGTDKAQKSFLRWSNFRFPNERVPVVKAGQYDFRFKVYYLNGTTETYYPTDRYFVVGKLVR